MKAHFTTICLSLILLSSCQPETPQPGSQTQQLSLEAEAFLNEVLNVMQNNSINRFDIDWVAFRREVIDRANSISGTQGVYAGIQRALELLGDNHSFFEDPTGTFYSGASSLSCSAFFTPPDSLPEDIGYVKVDGFSGPSSGRGLIFAKEIEDQIRAADKPGLSGWIVDLRGNTGGNMWPMLAGIGPILGEGIAGYFIGPDSSGSVWGYREGSSYLGQSLITTLAEPYTLITPDPKVAVLHDVQVGSSGEAVAIAFINRPDTRSFGEATCGLSTANQPFSFSNGSTLYLTVSYMADRSRKIYGVPIEPDVPATLDSIIKQAIDYLRE